eukprot:Gb_30865 [translate_table: standard]
MEARTLLKTEMSFRLCLALILLLSGGAVYSTALDLTSLVGINYGRIADNLPSPSKVAKMLRSSNVTNIRIYDADKAVLKAFRNTGVSVVVGIGNEYVNEMSSDPDNAVDWVKKNVQSYFPETEITGIAVGNEVYTGDDNELMGNLVPAMKNIHSALVTLNLDQDIKVLTAHSLGVFASSFPPSTATFKPELTDYLNPLLDFLSDTHSPFLVNAYPYFAYKGDPSNVPLDYVLFKPNQGVVDPNNNLHYDNMFYAQVDAAYAAVAALGHDKLEIKVSETGWPSKGDDDEAGATPENARIYNGNLIERIMKQEGTPLKPNTTIQAYIFALFNENSKPGPASERNYGLFKHDGTEAYDLGLKGLKSVSSAALSAPTGVGYSYSYGSSGGGTHTVVIYFSMYLQVIGLCSFIILMILTP